MSYGVMIGSTVGASVAAAAAAKARKEEEEMTNYKSDDLDGWEFKIMRSTWGSFGNREKLQRIRDEEAQAGWELVEKFDNYRVRFKRRTIRRSNDRHMTTDPYRISPAGSGSGTKLGLALGLGLALLGALFFAVNYTGGVGSMPTMMIVAIAVGIIFVSVVVMNRK